MKHILLIVIACVQSFCITAQTKKIPGTAGEKVNVLWNVTGKKNIAGYGVYEEIKLDENEILDVYNSGAGQLTIPFIGNNNEVLYATVFLRENERSRIKINNNSLAENVAVPRVFRGKIKNALYPNNVTVTLSPGYLSMNIYLEEKEIRIGENPVYKNAGFVLQRSGEVIQKPVTVRCMLPEKKVDDLPAAIPLARTGNSLLSSADKCTYVFVDCTNALYRQRGWNVQNVINYVYTLWNDVQTMYENEQMNVKISEINIWATTDPFNTTSSTEVANRSFADYYQNNFWGNMAMLLDWSNLNGGIAGGYGWAKGLAPNVCGTYNASPSPSWNFGSYAYCDLNSTGIFQNFPAMANAWQVDVCIHELGHLFSSRHTQSCSWPGGPIDNCVAKEGNCTGEGTTPTNGGTIMSYCHLTDIGTNYNNGFGPLPGNEIRAWVTANACISNCVSCNLFLNVGTITQQGFYHYEAFAELTADGSIPVTNTLLKLDGNQKVRLLPGFRAGMGSKVQVYIDGCGGMR